MPSGRRFPTLRALAAGAIAALAAVSAGNAADTCVGAALPGGTNLPYLANLNVDSLGNQFNPNGPGCANAGGDDWVVCFVPSLSCQVIVNLAPNNFDASLSLYRGVPCESIGSTTACTASAQGSGPAITPLALEAGKYYCVVADSTETGGGETLVLEINEINATDCGAMVGILFLDGFESGGTGRWSSTSPFA